MRGDAMLCPLQGWDGRIPRLCYDCERNAFDLDPGPSATLPLVSYGIGTREHNGRYCSAK